MDDFFLPEDTQLLDRLVDGELNDAERRELLLRLERTPDGWRRCALAFLEGQAWRSESKSWMSNLPDVVVRPTPAPVAKGGWSGAAVWLPLATAACLLVAMGMWVIVKDKDENAVARVAVPDGGSVVMVTPDRSFSRPITHPAEQANMRLVVDGGSNPEEVVEVPLVEAERLNEALFGPWSQAVPAEVMQMLERSGHQVIRERRLVPVDLRDGRRVVVPMDQLDIRPVSTQRYQ